MAECLDLLRQPAWADSSNTEIAEEIKCSEAHVRRARAALKALDMANEPSDDPDDNRRLLTDIITKFRARAELHVLLADAVATVKDLKAAIKDLEVTLEESVSTAAEEHPLFDRPAVIGTESESADNSEDDPSEGLRNEIAEALGPILEKPDGSNKSSKRKTKGRPVVAASL